MRFSKSFEKHLTAEWRLQYLRYGELKDMIRKAVDNAANLANEDVARAYFEEFTNEFFATLIEDLRRVNDFFEYKLAEAIRKHATFKVKLVYMVRLPGGQSSEIPRLPPLPDQPQNVRLLSRAYSEFYFSLVLLNNFQQLNCTGFYKICKKFDKNIKSVQGALWMTQNVTHAPLNRNRELKAMIEETENLYTEFLTKGDRAKAMAKLRVPPLGRRPPPTYVFLAGLMMGLLIVSMVICAISVYAIFDDEKLLSSFVLLYRGPFSFLVYGFLLAMNINCWQSAGVNHSLIFELNPRTHIEPVVIIGNVCAVGYVCTLSMLLFIHYKALGLQNPLYIPFICLVLPLALLINPLPVMNVSGRMWLLRVLGRILAAPFYNVNFADFWIADQMNSLVLCLVDHYQLSRFYIRFFIVGDRSFEFEPDYAVPVIRCLPSWFRLAQCLKRFWDCNVNPTSYLVNAFTYGSTIIVVIMSTIQMETDGNYKSLFHNPWMWGYLISSFISSAYCTAWDLIHDFGLFQEWKGENRFLRENLVYPRWFYYFTIFANIFIRFIWIPEMILIYLDLMLPYNCKTLTSLLEIVRRFFWNLLRLENEHLYNCGNFRATREMHISALNSQEDLLVESLIIQSKKNSESHA